MGCGNEGPEGEFALTMNSPMTSEGDTKFPSITINSRTFNYNTIADAITYTFSLASDLGVDDTCTLTATLNNNFIYR